MQTLFLLLIFQASLGGFDVLYNHEYREKLPTRPSAALEQLIHSLRELLYTFLFAGLANWTWCGNWAFLVALVLALETGLTAWDFVVEDRTRVLGPAERITHLILSMCGGAYVALLIPLLWQWSQTPTGIHPQDHGLLTHILNFFAVTVFVWGIRDAIAAIRLYFGKTPENPADTPHHCPPKRTSLIINRRIP